MNPLMNSVGSNAEGKLDCINAVVITHKSTVILIELRWTFSVPENRLKLGFSAVQAHKRTPLQAILRRGCVRFMWIEASCTVMIVKRLR